MTRGALQAVLNMRYAEKIEQLAKLGTVELVKRGRAAADRAATCYRGRFDDGTAACLDAELDDLRKAWRAARRLELEAVAS